MNGTRAPSPPATGRSIDIELNSHEIINIELDNLDPNPEDLLDLLKEGQCKVWIWTRLAAEYWRRGYLEEAERIAETALTTLADSSSSPPVHALLANIKMARARGAPKLILSDAREDVISEKTRDEFHKEATSHFNTGEKEASEAGMVGAMYAALTRGVVQLGARNMDDALRAFEGILVEKPTNVVALLGKATVLYARRQFAQSLKLFQTVLKYNPSCLPDPRIGIGLCLWNMGHKVNAKAAWQRSLEVNPSEWSAQLLLGLEAINASKDETQSQEERRNEIITGTRNIEQAFKKSKSRNSAAANALCELFLQKGQHKRALKLAERAIQYTEVRAILTDGYIRAGRVSHASGSTKEAMKCYSKAKELHPHNVLAAIGVAQMQLKNDDYGSAVHTLSTLLQQTPGPKPVEATVMLASLRAATRPGVSGADQAQEFTLARELLDEVCKQLGLPQDTPHVQNGHQPHITGRSARKIAEDLEMHVELARLWQGNSTERMERALKEALRISEHTGRTDPRLVNNLGVLQYMEDNLSAARTSYETALTYAAGLSAEAAEGMSTTILYNLARTYEKQGDDTMASEAYEKLINRHPEYIDAKIRQAQMLANINQFNDAHDLLKQALSSQTTNLNSRAFYTYFLIQSNTPKLARDFVFTTLRDHDKHDLYSLCAAGWIQYHQARESRDLSSKGIEDRRQGFRRSADIYEKALQLDPTCAAAAQGLAIVTAEDALGNLGGALGPTADESTKRIKNARDALDIFAKVRESLNDGSVYVNMGHCYYARDEFDRAIESYETALNRYYKSQDVPTLLYLCRSWYAKANNDQSFNAMNTALKYAQKAYHLHPFDKAILYNIAMIQQKAAEMLLSIKPAKRSLKDLGRAIEQANHAQKLFASLAADKSPLVPYSREIADQRRKYGDSMLRRCDEHLAAQKQWEQDTQAKLEAARQKRQQEKEQQEALERERTETLRREAERLAEERRKAREQALEWTRDIKNESDEERERKAIKKASRKVKVEGGSGDEGAEPKKKRRGKLKKANGVEEGDEALFSEEEEGDKPAKKRTSKKRVVRDDDDEETTAGGPRKKQIKSKEYISDSDEEMS